MPTDTEAHRMGESMAQIEFWLTTGSTYTYLSVNRIAGMAQDAGLGLVLRPFYLGRIFRQDGFWPFHPDTARTRYMWHDIARTARARGLHPKLPAPYPAPGVERANRLVWAAEEQGRGLDFLRASYRCWFEAGHPPGEEPSVSSSLAAAGLDAAATLARAESPEAEAALEAATEEARARGIFGAPSFLVAEELFWGDDRLEAAIAHASGRPAA